MKDALIILGTAFHSIGVDQVEVLEDYLFYISENGYLTKILSPTDDAYEACLEEAKKDSHFRRLKRGEFLLPGFIDTHIHAPQWAQAGKALDTDLPVWLNSYTFPLEASYKDITFTKTIYTDLVDVLLANGTTGAIYFGSVDVDPNKVLAEVCAMKGQRAYIGKVVMDEPSQCPEFYRDTSTKQALQDTETFLTFTKQFSQLYKGTPDGLITGVVTPRFIPTCTDTVLQGLGELAKQYNAPIQTHCSEGDWEHNYVHERFHMSDTESHDKFGLLTNKTILAHSVFLSDADAAKYKASGATIGHSPISNVLFANAVCPVRKRLSQGVNVGLATDISGGYSPSMFDAMRQAILSAKSLQEGVDINCESEKRGVPKSAITYKEAFYMATLGGAKAMGLSAGQFKIGNVFDAFIFDCEAPMSHTRYYDFDSLQDILQKIVFLGNRQNVTSVWVQGREVIKC